jgi:hypothetical protein
MHISDAQFLAQKKIKLFPEPIVMSKKKATGEDIKESCCIAIIFREIEF